MKRLFSVLLVATLLAGLFVLPAPAETTSAPAAGTVLYSQNFDDAADVAATGWTASATGACNSDAYTVQLVDNGGNQSLLITKNDGWQATASQFKVVDADLLTGVTKYTIQYTMNGVITDASTQYISEIALRFGDVDPDDARKGEYLMFSSDNASGDLFKNYRYDAEGNLVDCGDDNDYAAARCSLLNRKLQVAVEVDAEAGTVSYYLDGELINTRTGASTVVGGIYIKIINATVAFDDFTVSVGGYADAPEIETARALYEQDFENTAATDQTVAAELGYTLASTIYSGANEMRIVAWGESRALLVDHVSSTYGCYQMVPATALDGVTQYTIQFTMQQDESSEYQQDLFGVRFGTFAADSAVGDWVVLRAGSSWNTISYDAENTAVNQVRADFTQNAKAEIRIEVDAVAGTVRLYCDGVLLSTATDTDTAVGGIYWMFGATKVYIDNVKVTEGISAAPVEDDDENWPVRPDADYTGKQAGEVIIADNFDAAQTIEDLYWQPVDGTFFDKNMIDVELADAVNGSTCVKVTGGTSTWGAFEIVPAKALETYDVYTVHMTLNAVSLNNRFSLFYNTASTDATSDCGLLELRWNPMIIRNQGIVGGNSNSYTDDATPVPLGTTFELAVQIDRTTGVTITYLNGEFFNVGLNINTAKSALYIVAENCEVYMDDLMVTAGTYSDYADPNKDDDEDDDNNGDNPGDSTDDSSGDTSAETPTAEAPTAEAPETTAPAGGQEGGCQSAASLGGAAVLLVIGAASLAVSRKKRYANRPD